jgi:hypothetical protein
MEKSKIIIESRPLSSLLFSLFSLKGIGPSIGPIEHITIHETGHRSRTLIQSIRTKELGRERDLYRQKRLDKRGGRGERSVYGPDYFKQLELEESIQEVQTGFMGRLAIEENHVKGIIIVPGLTIMEFGKRMKEVEEAIRTLRISS